MVQETITGIEERIKEVKSLHDEKRGESLNLLSKLKTQAFDFPKTHPEESQSFASIAAVSIHEAMREKKKPPLLKISLVPGFELIPAPDGPQKSF